MTDIFITSHSYTPPLSPLQDPAYLEVERLFTQSMFEVTLGPSPDVNRKHSEFRIYLISTCFRRLGAELGSEPMVLPKPGGGRIFIANAKKL